MYVINAINNWRFLMSKRRKKKSSGAKLVQFLLMLVILGLVIFIFKVAVWDAILKKKAFVGECCF